MDMNFTKKTKKLAIVIVLLAGNFLFSQQGNVGINTANPQGVFHVDGKSSSATTNSETGIPTVQQQSDDFMVKSTGQIAVGTTEPSDYSMFTVKSSEKDRGCLVLK
jgi:hypothetical protein